MGPSIATAVVYRLLGRLEPCLLAVTERFGGTTAVMEVTVATKSV
jgi:hypothetical protein